MTGHAAEDIGRTLATKRGERGRGSAAVKLPRLAKC
jgi:hypothetical protein